MQSGSSKLQRHIYTRISRNVEARTRVQAKIEAINDLTFKKRLITKKSCNLQISTQIRCRSHFLRNLSRRRYIVREQDSLTILQSIKHD